MLSVKASAELFLRVRWDTAPWDGEGGPALKAIEGGALWGIILPLG